MASNQTCASLRAGYILMMTLVIALGLGMTPAAAQLLGGPSKANKGSGRKADRNNAIATIPFNKLVPAAARQIESVVNSPSIYRKLPVQTIECDRDFFIFLARHPESVVHTWQLMGITALTLDRTGPYSFESSDGAGTDSKVELVYGTPNLHVYYGTGVYEGPLFKNEMTGQCVMVLRSDFDEQGDQPMVTCRLDVFIRMPQSALDVAAKTLHPLFGKAADINFNETAKFFQRLNQAAVRDPRGIERLAKRLSGVSPEVQQKMTEVAHAAHERWGRDAVASRPRSLPESGATTRSRPGPVLRVSGGSDQGSVRRISR